MVVDDEVEQVYVSALHRGTGVAAQLMGEAERQVRANGNQRRLRRRWPMSCRRPVPRPGPGTNRLSGPRPVLAGQTRGGRPANRDARCRRHHLHPPAWLCESSPLDRSGSRTDSYRHEGRSDTAPSRVVRMTPGGVQNRELAGRRPTPAPRLARERRSRSSSCPTLPASRAATSPGLDRRATWGAPSE